MLAKKKLYYLIKPFLQHAMAGCVGGFAYISLKYKLNDNIHFQFNFLKNIFVFLVKKVSNKRRLFIMAFPFTIITYEDMFHLFHFVLFRAPYRELEILTNIIFSTNFVVFTSAIGLCTNFLLRQKLLLFLLVLLYSTSVDKILFPLSNFFLFHFLSLIL